MFWLKCKLSFIDSICQLPLKISLTCTWVYKANKKLYRNRSLWGNEVQVEVIFFAKLTASHMLSIELNLEYYSKWAERLCMCADLDLSSTCPEGRERLQSLFPVGAPVCWGESDQTPGYTAQDGWRPAGPQFNTESSPDNRGHTHTHTHKQADLSCEPMKNICKQSQLFHKTIALHAEGSIWSF